MLTPTITTAAIKATLGEAIDGAKSQLADAIADRIETLMCQAIARAASQIADAVLESISNPFDADEIEGAIGDEIGSFDWSSVIEAETVV